MAEHHGSFRKQAERDHASKLRSRMASGGDVAQDKAMVSSAVRQHEDHDHPGSPPTKLKLKTGGRVDGAETRSRLDRAKGGRTKHKGGHKTVVNVVMPQGGPPAGAPPMMPPHPPIMAGPPPGGMPPGGPPMPPPMPPPGAGPGGPPMMPPHPPMGPPVGAGVPMRKNGGRIKDGARSGPGRLEKLKSYGLSRVGDVEDKGFTADGENKQAAS